MAVIIYSFNFNISSKMSNGVLKYVIAVLQNYLLLILLFVPDPECVCVCVCVVCVQVRFPFSWKCFSNQNLWGRPKAVVILFVLLNFQQDSVTKIWCPIGCGVREK